MEMAQTLPSLPLNHLPFPIDSCTMSTYQMLTGLIVSLASPKETFLTLTRPKVPHILCVPDGFLLTGVICEESCSTFMHFKLASLSP